MPLHALKGDITKLAPENSQAAAFWIYAGFNTRRLLWEEYIPHLASFQPVQPNNIHLNDQHPFLVDDDIAIPWMLPNDTLWSIRHNGQLEYIYIFSNHTNRYGVDSPEEMDQIIANCLTVLRNMNIRSVSFVFIPTKIPDRELIAAENLSAQYMINSIRNWLDHNDDCMNVYLIDRTDGFQKLL